MSNEKITRSVSIDVWLPEAHKEKYKQIIESIRHYRGVARHTYGILFAAHAAGADFKYDEKFSLRPNNERCKQLLALALDKMKEGGELYKAPVYEVREYILKNLAPNWKPFVFDSLRQDVYSRWKAPDTEFPKAQRGYLSLQGARGVAKFQRIGIGFPQLTAKPRLEGHSIFLDWDREIGEIEFKFEKLDSHRFWVWRQITENPAWSAGTVFLKEIDGVLNIGISYDRPAVISDADPGRVLKVTFSDQIDSLIRMSGPDGEASYDSISVAAALGGIDELRKLREYYEKRKSSTGAKNKPWGVRNAFVDVAKTLNNVTVRRERQCKDWSHRWTKRIIDNAKRWRCKTVEIHDLPKEEMLKRPWGWHQFKLFAEYKTKEIGCNLVFLSAQHAQAGKK